MGKGLSVESQNAAVRERLTRHHTRIIDEKLHGEVVGTVHHKVVFPNDIQRIRGVEKLIIGIHLHIGVDGLDLLFGTLHLWYTHILGEMNHLSLQVAQIHHIRIHDADTPDAGCCQIETHGSPQAASSHHEHTRVHYLFLSLDTHILQQDMPRVSLYLFF